MQEYWINAYDFSVAEPLSKNYISYGHKYSSRERASTEYIKWGVLKQIPCYRIHVKLKSNKIT
jgi:hypothetical protein